jgi:uncharacterized protein (TIGR03382 family)
MSVGRPLLVVLALALAPGASLAQDFRRTLAKADGSTVLCITWNERKFTYHTGLEGSLSIQGEAEFAAVDAAFATWQALSATCSDFTFTAGERTATPKVGKGTDKDNVVVFRERDCREVAPEDDPCWGDSSCGNAYGCWDHGSSVIGLTTVTYSKRTGIAIDADIELNGAGFLFTAVPGPPCEEGHESQACVAYDVQNTVTHEIGHVVGLDHVARANSTMAATAPIGETSKRVIDLGTANGFCSTYPRGQPPVPCDEQLQLSRRLTASSSGAFGCSSGPAGPPSLWAAAIVWLAVQRRRSRLTPARGRLQA